MDKKTETKRIIIFLVLVFALQSVPFLFYKFIYGGDGTDNLYIVLGTFSMFTPALAHILTRIITKEGWKDSLLGTNFRKAWKWYFIGAASILVFTFIGQILLFAEFFPEYTAKEFFEGENRIAGLIVTFLNTGAFAISGFLICMGEEYGWRGYLFPKLEKVTNIPVAILITGVVWGVWHYPNGIFLDDASAFAEMLLNQTLSCILICPFFVLLTKKSGSIYPASVAHSLNNSFAAFILTNSSIMQDAEKLETVMNHSATFISYINLILIAVISTALLIYFKKKENISQ